MDHKRVVLIIDDDADDRALFLEALKEVDETIKCLSADGGKEGINLLQTATTELPNLIFMDLNMPGISGKQCLTEIKKNPKFSHVPVVIYSTTKRQEDVEATQKLGAAYFLTKPVLFKDICNSIKTLLEGMWENYAP